ncbi:hypothetical protein IQ277_35925 [Nostocales cyanobacterium LEGE 12452]|nr:hypothetical protein [Nostocales cyanobacterium LEGE 12452]
MKLLLVIDQFEELITICNPQEKELFLNFLANILEANHQQISIVLTLRSDFEPRFLDSVFKSYWTQSRFPVRAMRSEELRQALPVFLGSYNLKIISNHQLEHYV